MAQEKDTERRTSERFAMEFIISIHRIHDDGEIFLENTVLHDVSGGGISFLSHMPHTYHPGQRLHISIILPGTDHLEARLEGNATVVRIGHMDAGMYVGASMDEPLDFISAVHQASLAGNSGHGA
jgi:hypothetical protein